MIMSNKDYVLTVIQLCWIKSSYIIDMDMLLMRSLYCSCLVHTGQCRKKPKHNWKLSTCTLIGAIPFNTILSVYEVRRVWHIKKYTYEHVDIFFRVDNFLTISMNVWMISSQWRMMLKKNTSTLYVKVRNLCRYYYVK